MANKRQCAWFYFWRRRQLHSYHCPRKPDEKDGQTPTSSEVGIKIEDGTNWTNAVIDQNVIEVGTELNNAITRRSFSGTDTTINTFNNLKPNGVFVPSYDRSSQTQDQELTTDVEADILGL